MAPISFAEMYAEALDFATAAHQGQKYGDEPYINHPVRVSGLLMGETAKIAALLHDVVEDTDVTLEEVAARFGQKVADVVDIVTRREDETYPEFILRIRESNNSHAIAVKIADLTENMRDMPPSKQSLRARYESAITVLLS